MTTRTSTAAEPDAVDVELRRWADAQRHIARIDAQLLNIVSPLPPRDRQRLEQLRAGHVAEQGAVVERLAELAST